MFLERIQDRVIMVVGDVMLDHFVFGGATRVSPEAPALVLNVQREAWMLGGAGNVAANVASLGGRAILIGRVGTDEAAGKLASLALSQPGRVSLALIDDTFMPTTVKTRYLAGDRHLLRADREEIGLSVEAEAAIIAAMQSSGSIADAIVVSDYAKGVISDAVLDAVRMIAAERRIPVVVDPKRRDLAGYHGATLLTPNRKELAFATGFACNEDVDCERAAEFATAVTGAAVLLTRSEHGISLHRKGHDTWFDVARARVVRDVSGAGDTVVAAVALGLAAGLDMSEAAHSANVAAGVAVGKAGTSLVTPEELKTAMSLPSPEDQQHFRKLLTLPEITALRERWREEGLRIGFTNGCFDLLHPGHVRILREAKATCDRLIVGLNADSSVRRLKGPTRPVQSEVARAEVLAAMEMVDLIFIFAEDTPYEAISALKPDVLVKGADYTEDAVVGGDMVKASGGRVVLVDLVPDQSTSGIIARSNIPEPAA